MSNDVEEIKNRLNIVDLVGEYIHLEKAGTNWRARCPFHNDKSPSFMVNEEKQIYHCFGCGNGGDAFSFLMEIEGLEFREALKVLAEKSGVKLSNSFNSEKKEDKNRIFEILELATKFYEKQLWEGVGKEKALSYLKDRALQDEFIKKFRLGYAPPGWRNLADFLLSRNYSIEEIIKTGLVIRKDDGSGYYDRFRDRIMFPIADAMERVLGFSGRVAPGGDESQAKYVNTPETQAYHKSYVLYGIDKAKHSIRKNDRVILVEGNMDVVASHQAGFSDSVAVSGTALTSDQLNIIKRYTSNIYMFFDMDEAGKQALLRSAKLAFEKEINVFVISVQNGKDAADVVKEDPQALEKAVSKALPAMEYFSNLFFQEYNKDNPQDKKKIVSEMMDIISSFASEIDRQHWIKKLAQKIDVNEKVIHEILEKILFQKNKSTSRGQENDLNKESFNVKKRSDVLKQEIIGIILADKKIWKKVVNELKNKFDNYFQDGEVKKIILNGGKYDYDFGKIQIDSGSVGNFLRKLYFENRYNFNQNGSDMEVEVVDNSESFNYYWKELEKELKKDRMREVEKDIKKAEENGDKKAIEILNGEFTKLMSEIRDIQ